MRIAALLVLLAACSKTDKPAPACVENTARCNADVLEACVGGAWTTWHVCGGVCDATPGHLVCTEHDGHVSDQTAAWSDVTVATGPQFLVSVNATERLQLENYPGFAQAIAPGGSGTAVIDAT